MNRRAFLTSMAGVVGFSILPPSTTYARIWRVRRSKSVYELLIEGGDLTGVGPLEPLDLTKLLAEIYAIKKHRERNPYRDPNRIYVWGKANEFLLSECRRVGIRVEPCLKTL